MRDKSMGLFLRDQKARQIAVLVSESFWYRWVSMGVIAVSIIAVIWTPNSAQIGPDSKAGPLLASHAWSQKVVFRLSCLIVSNPGTPRGERSILRAHQLACVI